MTHKKKLDIILFSHSDGIAELIRTTLSHAYSLVEVSRRNEVDELGQLTADIVFVDCGGLRGPKLDHLLDQLPDIPVVIVVDGMADVHHLSHLMQGRRELITQHGLEGLTLIQAVHHLLDRQRLHAQLKKTARHLKELSIRDDMTRLYNHRHFNELLTQEVKKSNRYKRPLGLVMVALKNFTAINETYGHHEGDRLLARTAGIISETVRDVDITARYGDNEFAIILPETDEDASVRAGQRIFEALSRLTVNSGDGEKPITVSVGVAALNEEIRTKKELLKAALRALIEAKRCHKSDPIKSASQIMSNGREVKENRQFIENMGERITAIARRSERTYFHELLKTISEIPLHKKYMTSHAERVAFFSERLGSKLKMSDDEIRQIRRASLLHDIGKLAIDMDIVNKPGQLTAEERKLIQHHPLFGIQMLGESKFMLAEPDIILHHHERFDGTGYPEGMAGTTISLGARIVSITEAWDTMITPQPYRSEPLSFDQAIAEMRAGAGTQFDPELVDMFACLITG